MRRTALLLAAVLALGVLVCAQNPLLINGAGATFPYPIYSKWFDEYHKKNRKHQVQLPVGWVRRRNQADDGRNGGFRSDRWADER